MPTIPLVLTILLVLVIILCVVMSFCCIQDRCPVCAGIFAGFVILSSIMIYNIANYESQYEWVIKNKPKCTEETVKCLNEQIDWVHDSVTTASRLSPYRLKIINEINSNDSTHIRLLKESLENLRNTNKKEN